MPDLTDRTDFDAETEDLACDFVKEAVGRFDWRNNWLKLQAAGVGRQRAAEWLRSIKSPHDPDEITAYLDHMCSNMSGRWL